MMSAAVIATWSSFSFICSDTMKGQFILLRQAISIVTVRGFVLVTRTWTRTVYIVK